jgi:hypothetical protein
MGGFKEGATLQDLISKVFLTSRFITINSNPRP